VKQIRSILDTISRHPATIALFSILLGTWLFGHVSYLRATRDARRDKSVAFLEETSKQINNVLTEVFFYTKASKRPPDDSLRKASSALWKQRLDVAIRSEAFLRSPTFSKQYDEVIREIDRIVWELYQPAPQYEQLKHDADIVWDQAKDVLSKALSDALRD
jgi:hypothetical protein